MPVASEYAESGYKAMMKGDYQEAIKLYTKAIELDPKVESYFYNRALSKNNLGRYEEAISDYDKAISLEKSHVTLYSRGYSKAKLERHEGAIKDYNEAIKLNSKEDPGYFHNHGFSKAALGRHEEAIEDYDKAIENSTDDNNTYVIYLNRGISKAELGQNAEAIKDYNKAIELILKKPIQLNPEEEAEYYYRRGFSKAALGQDVEAIKDYSEAIELNPDNITYVGQLAISKKKLDNKNNKEASEDYKWYQWPWHGYIKPASMFLGGIVAIVLTEAARRYWRRRQNNVAPPAVVPGGVGASELSVDMHPLRDIYEEMWLESQPPKDITIIAPHKFLSILDSKPHMTSLPDQKDEIQETAQPKSNISSSFNQSLSTNDYLGVVSPYLTHYTRKYSPFTLPWNRENDLSAQDRKQLNAALKKRNHLEKNFAAQQKSRAANYEFFSDKISFVEKELRALKSDIDGLLEKGKGSLSQLAEVQSRLERIEEVAKQLSVNNKKLRRFEARKKRLTKRNQKTERQACTILHYNVTKNCLTQEVVYDHSPFLLPVKSVPLKTMREASNTGSYRFSQSQQFWWQPAPSPLARIVQDQAQIEEKQVASVSVRVAMR